MALEQQLSLRHKMLKVVYAINQADTISGNIGNIIFPMETNIEYLRRKLASVAPELIEVLDSLQVSLEDLKQIKTMIEQNE